MKINSIQKAAAVIAVASVAVVGMAGCVPGEQAAAGGSSGQVVFANTGGVLAEIFQKNAYPALKDKGITVLEESPNDKAKLTAMVQAGNPSWDLFHGTPYDAIAQCGVLFEKIDYSKISVDGLQDKDKNDCSVTLMNSSFLLVYNKKTYGNNPPTSWKDFYNPDFPGNRGIMNYSKDAGLETALLGSGVDPANLYPINYDKAFQALEKIRSKTKFFKTGAEQAEALQSGTVDMMIAWPGRAYDAKKNGTDLGVVWNQPINYSDSLAIVKGAKNKDAAYELINSILSTNSQNALSARLPYAPANTNAKTSSDPLMQEFVNSGDKAKGTTITRDDAWWSKNLDEATKKWSDWVNR